MTAAIPNYKNTQLRSQRTADKKVSYLDCGTSGGVWGLTEGYSLMIGGKLRPLPGCGPSLKHWRRRRIEAGDMWAPAVRGISRR